jgi:hypothetical protein
LRALLVLFVLLPAIAAAEAYRAGSASGTWKSDSTIATGGTVSGMSGALPYDSHRWGAFTLNVPASGTVTVKLHFREPWANPGQRVFHVELEGNRMESSLDVAALAGHEPLVRLYIIPNITDGALTVKFIDGGPDDPMYSAIEVTSTAPPPPPTPTVTGEATVSWSVPTQNADGSAFTNLAGFRVYRGTSADALNTFVSAGATARTHTFTGLPAGTWYFALTTLNTLGEESRKSGAVSTVVTGTACPAQPAAQTRTASCPTGQVGSYQQTSIWQSAAAPTCWVEGTWLPTSPPAGACTTPPVIPVVVAVVPGLSMSPVFGISSTGARSSTVLGFVPVGKPCTGSVVYSYRGQSYRRFTATDAVWWQSTATANAAVACK